MSFSPRVLDEIARLMRDPDSMRDEWERIKRSGRRSHYDPNQPRVPAGNSDGGQWTDDAGHLALRLEDDGERPTVHQARFDLLRRPIQKGIEAVLALFAGLSAQNTRERQAVFAFNAREYLTDPSGKRIRPHTARLNRDEVGKVCGRLIDVQSDTDIAADTVKRNGGLLMSPSQRGTAIHKELENLINGRSEAYLHAEVSRIKSQRANVDYGTKGSIRIDVLEYAGEGITCVYDIKTGKSRWSRLTPARMRELAEHALLAYPNTRRIIVTEVRPSR
jgi:hypothetical protein